MGHPAEVGNRASNHFACRQLREKGHCVVSVSTAACGADDSKVSFGIKSNYQVGDGLAPSKGTDGDFPVILAVARGLGAQPNGLRVSAAVPGQEFKYVGRVEVGLPASFRAFA